MGGPNDITRGKDGYFYIAKQEGAESPAGLRARCESNDARPYREPLIR